MKFLFFENYDLFFKASKFLFYFKMILKCDFLLNATLISCQEKFQDLFPLGCRDNKYLKSKINCLIYYLSI